MVPNRVKHLNNYFDLLLQKQLIELTRTAGQKLLFERKYEYAIPAAMQSLKFSIDVYGLSSIELVPSYLILGEACIGTLKRCIFVLVITNLFLFFFNIYSPEKGFRL